MKVAICHYHRAHLGYHLGDGAGMDIIYIFWHQVKQVYSNFSLMVF